MTLKCAGWFYSRDDLNTSRLHLNVPSTQLIKKRFVSYKNMYVQQKILTFRACNIYIRQKVKRTAEVITNLFKQLVRK